MQEAIGHYEQALRIKPDYAEAHNNLGSRPGSDRAGCRRRSGTTSRRCGSSPITPRRTTTWDSPWCRQGRLQEAIGHYEQALRIKPDYAEAHYNLGVALEQAGRVQEAIGHYEQALRIKPDFAEAQNKLARLRAAQ